MTSRLLVIDDDVPFRTVVVETLQDESYDVDSAGDGVAGLARARENPPDLVLCDIMMDGLDGFGFLSALRQDPATATIPVIFLTGIGEPTALRKGMDLGADDYLSKPVSRAELLQAVRARLARSSAVRREGLRRLDALRADLAKALPHEFLTPLTAVMGLSSLLMEDGAVPASEVKEVAQGIFLGGAALQRTITKFLLYAEIETRPLPHPPPLLPGAAAAAVIEQAARGEAERAGRKGDLALELESVALAMSRDHLHALVLELVQNAFKFSIPPSPVAVRYRADGDAIVLTTSDEGQGMSAAQLSGLERPPFLRRHQGEPGIGLGLSIVRRLVNLHGGAMAFHSELQRGTKVEVRLPEVPAGA
jgi:two-component system, sensor histidine kinase and response regulator